MSVAGPPSALTPPTSPRCGAARERAAEAADLRPLGLGGLLLGAGVLGRVAAVADELRRTGDVVMIADGREMAGATGEVKTPVAAALLGGMTVRAVTLGDEPPTCTPTRTLRAPSWPAPALA